jgi:hypothetical protein
MTTYPTQHTSEDLIPLVRRAWAEALGHDDFTDKDSFFHVGGHSLAALHVVRVTGEAVRRKVSVRLLLVHPTVSDFARVLTTDPSGKPPQDTPAAESLRP